jgi:serine/threonine protein phosphatase PrpC
VASKPAPEAESSKPAKEAAAEATPVSETTMPAKKAKVAESQGAVPPDTKSEVASAAVKSVAESSSPSGPINIAPENPAIRIRAIVADSAAMQGRRPKQEDRHVKIPDLTKAAKALKLPIDHLEQPCAFFGVYDGHQGELCSEFVAKNMHMKLLKKLTAQQCAEAWTEEHIYATMRDMFCELDAEFLGKFRTAPDGCTAVVAFITGTRLFVAWSGDSRCLLCRSTSQGEIATVAMTEDHRPSVPSEADRVKAAGGVIVDLGGALRVAHDGYEDKVREIRRAAAQGLGQIAKEPVALAVSRSFGDRHFKAVTGGSDLLIAMPSVRCLRLDKSHKFLALMCDGISDVMSNEDAIFELDYVRKADTAQVEVKTACGNLVQEAYKRGSEDNLTVLLARMQWVDVDPKAATAHRKTNVPAKQDVAAPKAAKSAASPERPGESAVDALKRKHREGTAERAEAEAAAAKERKVEECMFQAVGEGAI